MSRSNRRPLKVGILLPVAEYRMDGRTPRWADLLSMARLAEDAGFDSIWIVDHLLVHEAASGQTVGVWECWSLVSALAAATSTAEIGTLVACTAFRNPALLAKMAETVDEISGGRLILGLGAGNTRGEFHAFGFPWDHRASRFEEALTIIHGLLRHGQVDYTGRYYQARECVLLPRGPRPSGPPILVGTTGARMLRLTARHADIWNSYYSGTGNRATGIAPLREMVDEACREVGREPATLARSASVLVGMEGHGPIYGVNAPVLSGPPDVLAEEMRAYAREGISHVQIRVEPNTTASIEALARMLEDLDRG